MKWKTWLGACAALLSLPLSVSAQQKEIKIGYQPSPIQDSAIAIFERWGAKNNVKIVKVPNSYGVYVEKMTASLTSGSDQYDVIWHNDDWGQLWSKLLEPTDDIKGMEKVQPWGVDGIIFNNEQGKSTVVPMALTLGVFYYRSDLIKESELPTTWDEMIRIGQRLQKEGKVKYGYVGGMSMNNTWFTWLWSMWTNNCDVFTPIFNRDNKALAAGGFKPALDQPCMRQAAELWWDAINVHKISPRGMPTYDRNEANAVFMAGDAAFTVVDSHFFGLFNDPAKSKIAGKVSIANFPNGPSAKPGYKFVWNDIWGWAIPKALPSERKKLVKEMLSAYLLDEEGQIEMWKKSGGPPPNMDVWKKIDDPYFRKTKELNLDLQPSVHAAYYFANWPAVHKAFSDVVTKAVTGSREDIPKVLKEGMGPVHDAAVR
ncbi:ABC transporter substrate-binding protein [Variovorax boronicumulans]